MMHRRSTWPPNQRESTKYKGRWVALDNCRYDGSHRPVEGDVVDSDEDLAELCGRLHDASRSKCIILHCDDEAAEPEAPAESARGRSVRLLA